MPPLAVADVIAESNFATAAVSSCVPVCGAPY